MDFTDCFNSEFWEPQGQNERVKAAIAFVNHWWISKTANNHPVGV